MAVAAIVREQAHPQNAPVCKGFPIARPRDIAPADDPVAIEGEVVGIVLRHVGARELAHNREWGRFGQRDPAPLAGNGVDDIAEACDERLDKGDDGDGHGATLP